MDGWIQGTSMISVSIQGDDLLVDWFRELCRNDLLS